MRGRTKRKSITENSRKHGWSNSRSRLNTFMIRSCTSWPFEHSELRVECCDSPLFDTVEGSTVATAVGHVCLCTVFSLEDHPPSCFKIRQKLEFLNASHFGRTYAVTCVQLRE
jgi:hypothetical protein